MKKKYANLIIDGFSDSSFFSDKHRDNANYPFFLLREKLKNHNIFLKFPGEFKQKKILFEMHVNINKSIFKGPKFLFLWETELVLPKNWNLKHKDYKIIFSWNDLFVKKYKFKKFNLPVTNNYKPFVLGSKHRNFFCCAIAGNKNINKFSKNNLYEERLKTFKWFADNKPDLFNLYGVGWNKPERPTNFLGKTLYFYNWLRFKPFSFYKGPVINKNEILRQHKFSICYENARNYKGYITEKIFDCFFAGTVPVYWGAPNILEYVPKDCFIDRRDFRSNAEMFNFLRKMSGRKYKSYQLNIIKFIKSPSAKIFYPDFFCKTILDALKKDANLI